MGEDFSKPLAPRVFFSYAGDDEWWVDLFRPFFKLGAVRILDYKDESVPFGELSKALNDRIARSAAVVAFVSGNFIGKKWTLAEWREGLSETERRRLIFVPILLDADAIVWWNNLQEEGQLHMLSDDYQYSNFSNDLGGPGLPGRKNPEYIEKIAKLAFELQKRLRCQEDETTKDRTAKAAGDQTAGHLTAEDQAAVDKGGKAEDVLRTEVVILGHPSASSPTDLQDQTKQLAGELDTPVVTWNDGWRAKSAIRASIAAEANPIFVQPITNVEAADYLEDRDRTSKYLAGLGRQNSRVAIWLPSRYGDSDFQKAARERSTTLTQYPVLLANSPDGLAKWLSAEVNGPRPTDDRMTVQVEGMGAEIGVKAENVIAAKLIVDGLRDAVWGIVTHIVEKPKPAGPAWQFWATQFGNQLKKIEGSRAIVAVHDLNIPRHPNESVVRKKVEIKFEMMQDVVEAEQKQRADCGKPRLNLFWTALLVNHGKVLPFSNYPDDGRFKDWRLLEFLPPDGKEAKNSPPVPDPASLAVFRSNLLAWAAEP